MTTIGEKKNLIHEFSLKTGLFPDVDGHVPLMLTKFVFDLMNETYPVSDGWRNHSMAIDENGLSLEQLKEELGE